MRLAALGKDGIILVVIAILVFSTFATVPLASRRASAQSVTSLNLGHVDTLQVSALNWFSSSEDYDLTEFMYVGLFTSAFPPAPVFTPVLAAGYSMNSNATQFVINLRPNLKWSDGSPLNATDLWYTLYLDNATQYAYPPYASSFKIMNSTAVQVNFATSNYQYVQLTLASTDVAVLPYKIYSKVCPLPCFSTTEQNNLFSFSNFGNSTFPIVADGPYVITNYTSGEDPITFTANPYYYQGRPHLNSVNVWLYPDAGSEIAAYKAGAIDAYWTYGSYIDAAPVVGFVGHSFIQAIPALTYGVLFNAFNETVGQNYPITDPAFRLGLAYATNITQINSVANENYANTSSTAEDGMIATDNTELGFPASGPTGYTYDPAKAMQIFTAAGFKYSGGLLHYPNGSAVAISLYFEGTNPVSPDVSQLISTMWTKVGITVTTKSETEGTVTAQFAGDSGWEVIIAGDLAAFGVTSGPAIGTELSPYTVTASDGVTTLYWNNTVGNDQNNLLTYVPYSAQFNSTARTIANAIVTQVPYIPLFDSYNWQSVSNNFYWGSQSNDTGVFNTQATAEQQFYWETLYDVYPCSNCFAYTASSSSTSSGVPLTSSVTIPTTLPSGASSTAVSSSIPLTYVYGAIAAVVIVVVAVALTLIFRRRT